MLNPVDCLLTRGAGTADVVALVFKTVANIVCNNMLVFNNQNSNLGHLFPSEQSCPSAAYRNFYRNFYQSIKNKGKSKSGTILRRRSTFG